MRFARQGRHAGWGQPAEWPIVSIVNKLSILKSRRFVASILCIGAFLGMASIFAPDRLQAQLDVNPAPVLLERPSRYSSDALPDRTLLGQIESGEHTVKFYATERGPLYTVYDKSGRMLAELLTPDQIADLFPTLPLTDAHAEVPLKIIGTDVGPNW